ncbi:MAG: exodeoxyribonuclease VII large subunit [Burkholderiales bacterium]|nr:exodeoxyribonuclease VII large subunit [Burkholderiales bacterium]
MNDESETRPGAVQRATLVEGQPISVWQLTTLARQVLERNIPLLWVAGEISNFTRAPSGHCYFSLKDERAQVRCVLFRTRAQLLDWTPANGMQVEVRAGASFYEPRGEFQLAVDFMRRAGLGVLFEKFTRLQRKLEAEGLFDPACKRPLPGHPRTIGIVTSPRAAALRDVLIMLRRRMPGIPVIVYPTLVQGEGAAAQIAAALDLAAARGECDVLILCRGGGSIEDLWAFNEESVARALARCTLPVVSGVGHETDVTIADFVADMRAPPPPAAAALVCPDRAELAKRAGDLHARLRRCMGHVLAQRTQQVDFLARRVVHPGRRLALQQRMLLEHRDRMRLALARQLRHAAMPLRALEHRWRRARPDPDAASATLHALHHRLARALQLELQRRAHALERLHAHLIHLDPRQVLERGYSIVIGEDGQIVRSSVQVAPGHRLRIDFAHGRAYTQVRDVET